LNDALRVAPCEEALNADSAAAYGISSQASKIGGEGVTALTAALRDW